MIRIRLAVSLICILLFAFAGISQAGDSCSDLTDARVTIYSDTPNVQCQAVEGANITGMSWLAADTIRAVDVWGWNEFEAEVCFAGFGSIRFSDATTSPRTEVALDHVTRDNVTCASFGHAGTVMLMPEQTMGMMEMDTAPEMSMDSYTSMIALEGCMVFSPIYNVVFRATPGGDDIGRVKYGTVIESMARTPNWFMVEHDGVHGWISAHWVIAEGNCG